MLRAMKRILFVALASVFAGCGSSVVSCTANDVNGNKFCVETVGGSSAVNTAAQANCAVGNSPGVFASGGCSHSGALGGCSSHVQQQDQSFVINTWYYYGTKADVTARCSSLSQTFIAP
jgi:hypothetical protein